MKRPTFSLRDLLWLMLVVGMGLGWWLDQDRVRGKAERLQALTVKGAEAKLRVAETEFAQQKEIRLIVPGTFSRGEFRRSELQLKVAQAELETARARQVNLPNP
jgi:hypothetical protein